LFVLGGLVVTEAGGVTNLAATVIRIFTPNGTLVVEIYDPDVKVTIEGDGGLVFTGAGPQEVRLKPGPYRVQAYKDGKRVPLEREEVTITRGDKQSVKVLLEPAVQAAAISSKEPLAPGEVRRFVGHTHRISALALSQDGRRALSGSYDKTARLWNVETGEEIRRFDGHTDTVFWVALSPDGRRALSVSGYLDGTMRLWDAENAEELCRWRNGIGGVAFSPDSCRFLFYDTRARVLRLSDTESGKPKRPFKGPLAETFAIRFSPDGGRVLTGSGDKIVRLWDVETGEELLRFEGHTDEVRCVAISPDGRRGLSGGYSADRTVRLWDLESGKELHCFKEHREAVYSVAFSPNGRYAISGSGDQSARLWDLDTGEELFAFYGHKDNVSGVAFTPDGRHVLSSSADGTLRLWQLPKLLK
jgi:WD40 repeat protein